MIHSNQKILEDFFDAIISIVSQGTSDRYAAMVLKRFSQKNKSDFPFIKYIIWHPSIIEIDPRINSINSETIGKFITKLVNSIFSELFKHLLKNKLSLDLAFDLKKIGVKI